jgi:hypothetical protein
MSVYTSIHHCDQHISLQDFVERIVMQPWGRWYSHPLVQSNSMMRGIISFLQYLWSAWFAHQRAYGGRWSDQAVWSAPNPLSLCCSCSQHGGQGPPYTPFSGWKLNSNDPSHVQQAQGFGLPAWLCRRSSSWAAADGRRSSNVYEVNLWLWSFTRGKPRLGGQSVEKTFERQVAANEASKERAAENRRRRKADKAWLKVKEAFDSICIEYIPVYIPEIYLYIPILRKSQSEQWFINFRLWKTMQCVWDVLPIRSKYPRLPQR